MMRKLLRLSLIAFASTGSVACGLTSVQRQAVVAFSEAAVTAGGFAAETFPGMRHAAIEVNATDVELGGHASPADLDEGFHLEHVEPRVAAAMALESYGRLLQALVEDTGKDELTVAAARFVASAKSIPGRRLADEQYQALGQLVEGIGGLVTESRKARAIARIVPAYMADVDHLCDLLSQDFDPSGLHLAHRFDVTLQRLDSDLDVAMADRHTLAYRRIAVGGIRQISEGRALLTVVGDQGRATIHALRQANVALDAALRGQVVSLGDVGTVAVEVRNLAAAVRVLVGSTASSRTEAFP